MKIKYLYGILSSNIYFVKFWNILICLEFKK